MKPLSLLRTASEIALAMAILSIAALVGIAVVFRYLLNTPLSFSFEGSMLLFCWVTFVGAAIATAGDHHIGVDLLSGRLPPKLARGVELFRLAITLGCSLYLVWAGASLALRGRGKMPSLDIPNVWLYAALPVGFAFVAVIAVLRMFTLARSGLSDRRDAGDAP